MKSAIAVATVGSVGAAMPDCTTAGCPSMCTCVENKCADLYNPCVGDTQCDGILNCILGCSCGNLFCALGCVAGKTLNNISSQVKSCGGGCASSMDEEWTAYKTQFNKVFLDDVDEATHRKIFEESTERINRLNALNGEFVFGWTHDTDRKENERRAKGAKRPAQLKSAPVKRASAAAPEVVDWRGSISVSPVKNQGQCGSCWAFSATQTIESQFALDTQSKWAIELSPQQITSCTTDCDGCGGGWPSSGYEYVKGVAGLSNEWYWPYTQSMVATSATAACNTNVSIFAGPDAELAGGHATVTGFNYVIPQCSSGGCTDQDMSGLAKAVAEGPVSVCVNAGQFNDYTGGVMSKAACGGSGADDLDHCVQLVGYNANASSPYWIVKNSWSTTWGMDGYIYLEYPANTCGLANEATKPVIGNAVTSIAV